MKYLKIFEKFEKTLKDYIDIELMESVDDIVAKYEGDNVFSIDACLKYNSSTIKTLCTISNGHDIKYMDSSNGPYLNQYIKDKIFYTLVISLKHEYDMLREPAYSDDGIRISILRSTIMEKMPDLIRDFDSDMELFNKIYNDLNRRISNIEFKSSSNIHYAKEISPLWTAIWDSTINKDCLQISFRKIN